MPSTVEIYDALGVTASHYAGYCPAVSQPLLDVLIDRLPPNPALTLSIGCGTGLLEALMLEAGSRDPSKAINLIGVEVPDCAVQHLPEDRVVRVSNTTSVYQDVLLASAIVFVYPRQTMLIAQYLDAAVNGALENMMWFGHKNDWPEVELLLLTAFLELDRIEGPGIAESEMLAVASNPRRTRREGTQRGQIP